MSFFLESAVTAARLGGEVLISRRGQGPTGVVQKRPNDFVSDVDRASERVIVDYLRGRHPGHAIVAEEGASQRQYRPSVSAGSGEARRNSAKASRSASTTTTAS